MRLGGKIWALLPLAAALNVAGGWLAATLKAPLYLDSLGTILAAALGGPWAGVGTAAISNLLSALVGGPLWLFFLPPALVVGFLAGLLARQGFFTAPLKAALLGLILGLAGASCAAPIVTYALQGASGGGTDLLIAAFRALGWSPLQAVWAQSLASDPLDKILTALAVQAFIASMPLSLRASFPLGPYLGAQAPLQWNLRRSAPSSNAEPYRDLAPQWGSFYHPGASFWHKARLSSKGLVGALTLVIAFLWPWGVVISLHPFRAYPLIYLPAWGLALALLAWQARVLGPWLKALACTMGPLGLSMLLLNGLFGPQPQPLSWEGREILDFSLSGSWWALERCGRLGLVAAYAFWLLMTTSNRELLNELERLGLPPRWSYALLAALNFVPHLARRLTQIREAQAARGLVWGRGWRSWSQWPSLLGPLLWSVLGEAQERALYLESRGLGAAPKRSLPPPAPLSTAEKIWHLALGLALLGALLYPSCKDYV